MKSYIGLDIGGTNIKAGLVINGKIIKKFETKTQCNKGKKQILNNIIKTLEAVFDKKAKAIGIGCPGPLDSKKGTIGNTPNIPLKNVNIKKFIKDRFKLPVYLDNDANCFALGQALYGPGKNKNTVIGITLGTGVGGGIVINKKMFQGKGNAGELGHITINFDGPKSRCNNHGCIETYVSSRGILKTAKNNNIKVKETKELFNLASKGNKKAIKSFNQTGFYLGIGLANIINAFDPNIIIIGGKIADSWPFFNKSMKDTIRKRALSKGTKIVKRTLKDSGIIGAAALCAQSK